MSENQPFMTIVTRTCRRPQAFARNCASVDAQTDQDIQHLILVDLIGKGAREANRRFHAYRDYVRGEWVYILDDDNYLIDSDFVARIRRISSKVDTGLILVRGRWPKGLILPEPWGGGMPQFCRVDGSNFVAKAGPWKAHIHLFGQERGGDYKVLKRLFGSGHGVHWCDQVVFQVSQVGKGKTFEV